MRTWAIGLLALAACDSGGESAAAADARATVDAGAVDGGRGADARVGDGAVSPDAAASPVVVPAAVTLAERTATTWALTDTPVGVAMTPVGTVVGTAGGLFRLAEDAELVDGTAVVAVAAAADGALVARADGLFYWDGLTLVPSALADALDGHPVRALAAAGEVLWIGTDGPLYRLTPAALEVYGDLAGVQAVAASAEAAVLTQATEQVAVRAGASGLEVHGLGSEPVNAAAPGAGDVVLVGLEQGAARARVAVAGGATWRPLALGQTPVGGQGEALAADPSGGSWVLTTDLLVHIGAAGQTLVPRPETPETIDYFSADARGGLWLGGEGVLVHLPGDGPVRPVTWADDIAPFRDARCAICHDGQGVGPALQSQAEWARDVDEILRRVLAGQMPPGGGVGQADIARLQAWKDGGMP